jgi:hypothetical protein
MNETNERTYLEMKQKFQSLSIETKLDFLFNHIIVLEENMKQIKEVMDYIAWYNMPLI